jgi:four helix bundle protein
MATIRTFEDLNCWKTGAEIRRDISEMIRTFPSDEKFELCSQMRRAARSATNNIAEGFGRYHYQEFIRFCRISRASLLELIDHLLIAHEEKYISTIQLNVLKEKIELCVALINGFVKYLKSKKNSSVSTVEEPLEDYGFSSSHQIVVNTTY